MVTALRNTSENTGKYVEKSVQDVVKTINDSLSRLNDARIQVTERKNKYEEKSNEASKALETATAERDREQEKWDHNQGYKDTKQKVAEYKEDLKAFEEEAKEAQKIADEAKQAHDEEVAKIVKEYTFAWRSARLKAQAEYVQQKEDYAKKAQENVTHAKQNLEAAEVTIETMERGSKRAKENVEDAQGNYDFYNAQFKTYEKMAKTIKKLNNVITNATSGANKAAKDMIKEEFGDGFSIKSSPEFTRHLDNLMKQGRGKVKASHLLSTQNELNFDTLPYYLDTVDAAIKPLNDLLHELNQYGKKLGHNVSPSIATRSFYGAFGKLPHVKNPDNQSKKVLDVLGKVDAVALTNSIEAAATGIILLRASDEAYNRIGKNKAEGGIGGLAAGVEFLKELVKENSEISKYNINVEGAGPGGLEEATEKEFKVKQGAPAYAEGSSVKRSETLEVMHKRFDSLHTKVEQLDINKSDFMSNVLAVNTESILLTAAVLKFGGDEELSARIEEVRKLMKKRQASLGLEVVDVNVRDRFLNHDNTTADPKDWFVNGRPGWANNMAAQPSDTLKAEFNRFGIPEGAYDLYYDDYKRLLMAIAPHFIIKGKKVMDDDPAPNYK